MPADTLAVVRLASISQTSRNLDAFLLPALGWGLGGEPGNHVQEIFALKSLDGVDKQKPIWILLLPQGEEMNDPFIGLCPLSDPAKFTEQLEMPASAPGIYSSDDLSAVVKGNYAVMRKGPALPAIQDWVKNADWNQLNGLPFSSQGDLSLWIQTQKLIPMLRGVVENALDSWADITENSPTPMPANLLPILRIESGWVFDLAAQVDTVQVDLNFSADAVEVRKITRTVPGTPLADYFRTANFASLDSVLPALSANSWISMVANFDPKVYKLIQDRMIQDCAKMGIDPKKMATFWDLFSSQFEGTLALTMNPSGEEKRPFTFTEVMGLKESSEASRLTSEFLEMFKESVAVAAPGEGIKINITEDENAGKYKEIPYSKISMKYEFDDPESPEAQALKDMDMDFYMATAPRALILTTQEIGPVIDQVQSGKAPAADSLPWIKQAGPKAMLAMRLSLIEQLRMIKQQLAKTAGGSVNPLAMVEIPDSANTPGVTMDMRVEEGDAVSRMRIPAQEISTIRMAIMGGMTPEEDEPGQQPEAQEPDNQE
ncbi:MAG: hypothetical protein ACE15F_08385 [bacterium]